LTYVHLTLHAAYHVEANSAWVDAAVAVLDSATRCPADARRELHSEHKEILWEDGKAVSISCAAQKALSRFYEGCENLASPF